MYSHTINSKSFIMSSTRGRAHSQLYKMETYFCLQISDFHKCWFLKMFSLNIFSDIPISHFTELCLQTTLKPLVRQIVCYRPHTTLTLSSSNSCCSLSLRTSLSLFSISLASMRSQDTSGLRGDITATTSLTSYEFKISNSF